jgi:hypothetical protein
MVHIVPYFAALIGIAACYALRRRAGLIRSATWAVLAGYFVVQGAALWHRTVAVNGYAREYQPLVAFLRSVARPDDEIIGSAELGFGLGFYNPQLADDVWLGYWSHRRPTIVVVDRWYYQEVMKTASQRDFPVRGYFEHLLSHDFDRIRDDSGYQVYRRRTQSQ